MNDTKTIKKTLYFILQNKGGVGKSTFTHYLAELLKKEKIVAFDFDNNVNTTSNIKFIKTSPMNLLNEATKTIDRSKLDKFFLQFIEQNKTNIALCDFGGETSEQFKIYCQEAGTFEILSELSKEINFVFFVLIGGQAAFENCLAYIDSLYKNLKGIGKFIIVKNNYWGYNPTQKTVFKHLKEKGYNNIIDFNLIGDISQKTSLEKIANIIQNGDSILEKADWITRTRFKGYLNTFKDNFNKLLKK